MTESVALRLQPGVTTSLIIMSTAWHAYPIFSRGLHSAQRKENINIPGSGIPLNSNILTIGRVNAIQEAAVMEAPS